MNESRLPLKASVKIILSEGAWVKWKKRGINCLPLLLSVWKLFCIQLVAAQCHSKKKSKKKNWNQIFVGLMKILFNNNNNNCLDFWILNIKISSDKITLMTTVSTVLIEVNMLANPHLLLKSQKFQNHNPDHGCHWAWYAGK